MKIFNCYFKILYLSDSDSIFITQNTFRRNLDCSFDSVTADDAANFLLNIGDTTLQNEIAKSELDNLFSDISDNELISSRVEAEKNYHNVASSSENVQKKSLKRDLQSQFPLKLSRKWDVKGRLLFCML